MQPRLLLLLFWRAQRQIHEFEICRHLEQVFDDHWEAISDTLRPLVERGRTITKISMSMRSAPKRKPRNSSTHFSLTTTPFLLLRRREKPRCLAKGQAIPAIALSGHWQALPCINLPLLTGATGLPMGLQVIGQTERDDRLLRTSKWLLQHLQPTAT